jgi:hypothetical protein
MRRHMWIASAAVAVLVVATLGPAYAGASTIHLPDGAHSKCTTKTVKKKIHGKTQRVKVRVCVPTKPKPTATRTPKPTATSTPTPTPTATIVPANVTVSLDSAPPGFSFSATNGAFTLTDAQYGAQITLSRFALFKNTDGTYRFYMYLNATKVAAPSDGEWPSWYAGGSFGLVASNQHPYSFNDYFCDANPEFSSKPLYNGETTEGWVCSDSIDAQLLPGAYVLNWADEAGYQSPTVPVANLVIMGPSA